MFRCPHCQEQSISPLRKAILSPGLLATCNSCGESSSVGYPSWLVAMLPGSVLMLAAMFAASESIEWGLNIVGFLLMVVIPFFFTPLRKENE